ncbi:MAG: metalloregulator ArsR/SmtB family transcription factor [Hyphomonadaceae bacterium]|nr:metalloregulator ArsR/SmtB family transcription factor [Hyphomonadaceae bacterium]
MARAKLKADDVFNALGDPTRRAIVHRLARGPSSVSQLAQPLGITLTGVRQHLDVLEGCGLVRTEKIGRVRTCRFDTRGLVVIETWISMQRSMWTQALDNLGDLLDQED